jgi:hypothetical protein
MMRPDTERNIPVYCVKKDVFKMVRKAGSPTEEEVLKTLSGRAFREDNIFFFILLVSRYVHIRVLLAFGRGGVRSCAAREQHAGFRYRAKMNAVPWIE